MPESRLLEFYRGNGRDHRGRLLSHILGFHFDELERHHDYIQWLFPLPEPSGANASAPLLTHDDIAAFTSDPGLGKALLKSFDLMLEFYGLERAGQDGALEIRRASHFDERRRQWLMRGNHNFLRISRILQSLSLLGCSRAAAAFLECLEAIYAENPDTVGATTVGYWRRAVL
jgi:hypothetical protein